MQNQYNFKDFEQVRLKATQPLTIGSKTFEIGETVAYFDSIQIAGLRDIVDFTAARGGYDNRGLVFWETTREERLTFSKGIFSSQQFSLLNNARLLQIDDSDLEITQQEQFETDENGNLTLSYIPSSGLYCYKLDTGEKIAYTINNKVVHTAYLYTDIVCIYNFKYTNSSENFKFGQRVYNGCFELEGRTRIKQDVTGNVVTGIIKIPKLRIQSELSLKIGDEAGPIVANFDALALPVGDRRASYVSELYILDDDLSSDL